MVAPFFAASKGGGQCFSFPDVCKVPAPPAPSPIPTPFPNIAMPSQAKEASTKVKFVMKEAVTKKSEEPRTSGDEAGTLKGMVSNTNMDKSTFKKGSSKVKVQGQPVAHLTVPTGHNGSNANMPAGFQVAPCQTKVRVAP